MPDDIVGKRAIAAGREDVGKDSRARPGVFFRLLPLLVAVFAAPVSVTALASTQEPLIVEVPNKTLQLSRAAWKAMANTEAFADNFEARTLAPDEAWAQVLTVFKIPMSERDRLGFRVASGEFAEFFVAHPGKVTLLFRVDRGSYWLLSRQTLNPPSPLPARFDQPRPYLSQADNQALLAFFDAAVKRTRYQLQQIR